MQTIECKLHLETPPNSWGYPAIKDAADPTGELKAIEAFKNRFKCEPTKAYLFNGNFYFVVPVLHQRGDRLALEMD